MKIVNFDQRSEEWRRIRRGRPTASKFGDIVLPSGKPSAKARPYLYRLLWERLTGQSTEPDLSRVEAVQWGIEHEDEAANQFELISGQKLDRVGFYLSDDGRMGASPDRIVAGTNQGVEIKCPQGPTHIGYLLSPLALGVAGTSPLDTYIAQVQGQIYICQFDCVHLFSYRPDAPPFLITSQPDYAYLDKMIPLLGQFCDALDGAERTLRAMGEFRRLENDPLPGFPDEEE